MNVIVTSLALGSLYCLIAACIVFVFSIGKFLNLSILAYIALAPYVTASIAGNDPNPLWFIFSILVTIGVIFVVAYLVDRFIFVPLESSKAANKVIASICVLFLTLTIISIIWPSGAILNNPLDISGFDVGSSRIMYIDLVSVIAAIVLLIAGKTFLDKTDTGRRVRAVANDSDTAHAYGISRNTVSVSVNMAISILCTVTGVLLASPGSPRSGVISVIFFALIALAVVIVARHSDIRVCVIASFVIAYAQTYCAAHLTSINNSFVDLLHSLHVTTEITLGPTFADRFVPFAIALIASIAIPRSWIKEASHD